ncbi:MAG TPA: hypothetical protein VIC08_14905 [Cellvibrionaceae bacterium]
MTFYGLQRDEVLAFDAAYKSGEKMQQDDSPKNSWTIKFDTEDNGKNEVEFSPAELFTEKTKLSGVQGGIYMVASVITILLSLIYATGSLFADRRDRSILFFKSLPVSETQVVLTRLVVAVFVMPFLASLCALAGTVVFFIAASFYGALYMDLGWLNPWQHINPFSLYFKAVIAGLLAGLWALPMFAWILLCSAWAKKSPFLNIVMPIIILALFDRIVLEKSIVITGLKNYLSGFKSGDFFGNIPTEVNAKLDLGEFFMRADLWIGLIVAIAFIAVAIILRNRRFEM